jgi:hypothetical protein
VRRRLAERLSERREEEARAKVLLAWHDEVAQALERGEAHVGTQRDVYALVAGALGDALASWERIAEGTWTRPTGEGIRAVIRVSPLRGSYQLNCGLSLAWVPHLTTAGVRFHRTAKSARLDLYEEGQHHDASVRYTEREGSFIFLPRNVERAWSNAAAHAEPRFERAATPEAVLGLAQEQLEDRWAMSVHVPSPLYVVAFTQARLGRAAQAREALAGELRKTYLHLPSAYARQDAAEKVQRALERVLAGAAP